MKTLLCAALFLVTISNLRAQEKLPEYGKLEEIKGMTKVYVSAPSTDDRKMILSELKKAPSLTSVDSPDEAQFFLNYRIVSDSIRAGVVRFLTAELEVYILKDERKRIVWSKTKTITSKGEIPRAFVKALKKTNEEK